MIASRSEERGFTGDSFQAVVDQISSIGRKKHSEDLVKNARENLLKAKKSLRDLKPLTGKRAQSGIVVSAGPSVHRKKSISRILKSGYEGTVVAVDAAYVACLREGLIPDFIVTLDPHPTRMVRWFGDRDYERHWQQDDYFERQDLDVEFRKNSIRKNQENIGLVNQNGHRTRAIVASSSPSNVVARLEEAKFDAYWWNPLVDDPKNPESLTRQLFAINQLPCMNTGGNVGTAAWVFLSAILRVPKVAMVGVDLGYHGDTPYKLTQTYYELIQHAGTEKGIEKYFQEMTFPLTGEKFYTDPTYYWYRRNFLQLLEKGTGETFNCTEGGTLFGEKICCVTLDEFLKTT